MCDSETEERGEGRLGRSPAVEPEHELVGMRVNSVAQTPEKLYEEKRFVAYVVGVSVLVVLLFLIDLPWLNVLVGHRVLAPG